MESLLVRRFVPMDFSTRDWPPDDASASKKKGIRASRPPTSKHAKT
jgi:hypothetical protein